MELVVGKKYNLRSGRIVRCLCTDAPKGAVTVILMYEDNGMTFSAFSDGRQHASQAATNENDVVSEFKEPSYLWYNLYPRRFGSAGSGTHPYETREDADREQSRSVQRIGVVRLCLDDNKTEFFKD